jgi:hypothetical protein
VTKHKKKVINDPDVLPMSEMRRVLLKYARARRQECGDLITILDIEKECKILRNELRLISKGKPTIRTIGVLRLRRVSRFLQRLEAGYIVKRDGNVVYLEEDTVVPKKPDIVFSLTMPRRGGPTIVFGAQPSAPKMLPNLFKMAGIFKGFR